jgi:hypothetical protein
MAEDAWIGEEVLPSGEGMEIGAAQADPSHRDQGLSGVRGRRLGDLGEVEPTRLTE